MPDFGTHRESTARAALRALAARAEVEQSGTGYRLVDPLFDEWIERLRLAGPEADPTEEN